MNDLIDDGVDLKCEDPIDLNMILREELICIGVVPSAGERPHRRKINDLSDLVKVFAALRGETFRLNGSQYGPWDIHFRASEAERLACMVGWRIGRWNVSRIRYFHFTFMGMKSFDDDIGTWDMSSADDLTGMFWGATRYTGKGLDKWNVSNVRGMRHTFHGCSSFNGRIDAWDVSGLLKADYMFMGCKRLSRDLSQWNLERLDGRDGMLVDVPIASQGMPWFEHRMLREEGGDQGVIHFDRTGNMIYD